MLDDLYKTGKTAFLKRSPTSDLVEFIEDSKLGNNHLQEIYSLSQKLNLEIDQNFEDFRDFIKYRFKTAFFPQEEGKFEKILKDVSNYSNFLKKIDVGMISSELINILDKISELKRMIDNTENILEKEGYVPKFVESREEFNKNFNEFNLTKRWFDIENPNVKNFSLIGLFYVINSDGVDFQLNHINNDHPLTFFIKKIKR